MNSWAGSGNSLGNRDLLIFLEVLSCSLTLWTEGSHPLRGTATLRGMCTVWATCPCLSMGWSECMGEKYPFLPVPVLNARISSVVWDCAEADISQLLLSLWLSERWSIFRVWCKICDITDEVFSECSVTHLWHPVFPKISDFYFDSI